jgi:hypothetical protein
VQLFARAVVEFVPQSRVFMRGGCGGNGRMRYPRRVVIAIASRKTTACKVMLLLQSPLLEGKSFKLCGSSNSLSSCELSCELSVCLSSLYD